MNHEPQDVPYVPHRKSSSLRMPDGPSCRSGGGEGGVALVQLLLPAAHAPQQQHLVLNC